MTVKSATVSPNIGGLSDNSINEIVESGEPNTCETQTCAKESAAMQSSLDQSVDPCENFYEFACGNYVRNTIIPEDKTIVMSFTEVQDKVQEQLRSIIMEEIKQNESKPFKLAKTFNQACLNETALNEMGKKNSVQQMSFKDLIFCTINFLGITPLIEILEKFGGWPAVKGEKWLDENWDWIESNKKIANDGLIEDLIIDIRIISDSRNSSKRIISVNFCHIGSCKKLNPFKERE